MVCLFMEPTGLRIKRSSTSHALPGGAGGEWRGRGGYEAFADKRERHHDVGSEQTGTVASPGGAAAASAPGAAESCYSPTYEVATSTESADTHPLRLGGERKVNKSKPLISVELAANGARLRPEETSPATGVWAPRRVAVS